MKAMTTHSRRRRARQYATASLLACLCLCTALADTARAQAAQTPAASAPETATPAAAQTAPAIPAGVATPAGYVIGADDTLTIVFWRDKDMSSDVSVRPDGRISLPLLNDVQAAGLTPEELRAAIEKAAGKYIEDPAVTVVVKNINSRKVYILGQVGKPGPYPLVAPTTVLQLIATAGGVSEYAKAEDITIIRGAEILKFNYKDVTKGKKIQQNVQLQPGDTVNVP